MSVNIFCPPCIFAISKPFKLQFGPLPDKLFHEHWTWFGCYLLIYWFAGRLHHPTPHNHYPTLSSTFSCHFPYCERTIEKSRFLGQEQQIWFNCTTWICHCTSEFHPQNIDCLESTLALINSRTYMLLAFGDCFFWSNSPSWYITGRKRQWHD